MRLANVYFLKKIDFIWLYSADRKKIYEARGGVDVRRGPAQGNNAVFLKKSCIFEFFSHFPPNKLSKNLLLTSDMNSFRPGVAPVFVPDTGNAPEIDPASCYFNIFDIFWRAAVFLHFKNIECLKSYCIATKSL